MWLVAEADGPLAVRAAIAYGIGLLIGAAFLILGGLPAMHDPGATDLSYIWAGPRSVLDGANPYDAASWQASVERLGTQAIGIPPIYTYPPVVLLVLLPLGLLPLPVVDVVWIGGSLVAAVLAVGRLLRLTLPDLPLAHGIVGLTLLASQPSVQALINVQWTFWIVAALAAALVWIREGRGRLAGVAFAMTLCKPQLAVLTIPALVLHARALGSRSFLQTLMLVTGVPLLSSVLLWGPWWSAWFSAMEARIGEPTIATVSTLFGTAFGLPGRLLTLAVIAVLAVILARRIDPASPAWPGVAIAMSVAAAPYARSYDQVLLVVAIPLVAGEIAARGHRHAALWLTAVAGLGMIGLSWWLRLVVAAPLASEVVLGLVTVFVAAIITVPAVVLARPASSRTKSASRSR